MFGLTRRSMARLSLIPTLGVVLVAAFAGCLDNTSDQSSKKLSAIDPESLPHSHGSEPMMSPFGIEMAQCEEGGFVAAYPLSEDGKNMPGGWVRADISEEIGNPVRTGMGSP